MTDFPDWQTPQAAATALANTNLTGTGLAKEAGGNLQTARTMLDGTAAGALLGAAGNTIAKEIAAMIAGGSIAATPGGTPLLHGFKSVFTVANQVIAVNGTFSTGAIAFTKPGYVVRIAAQMSAAGAVKPFGQADMVWTVAATAGSTAWEDKFGFEAGDTFTLRTNGRGPAKGDTLTLTITNGDAADTMTVSINVWESTQAPARDDWRGSASAPSSANGRAINDSLGNILLDETFNVPANSTVGRNLPLYSGLVQVSAAQNPQAGSTLQITPVADLVVAAIQPIAVLNWNATPNVLQQVILPRVPCALLAVNVGAAAEQFTGGIVAVEYAT